MIYKEQIEALLQEFYATTKHLSTSRTYKFSYEWINLNFGLDLQDQKVQGDVSEASYTMGNFMDLIQTLDFDDVKEEVIVMIWENGDKKIKRYQLKDYKKFSDEALVCPPVGEFDDGTIDEVQWYKDHQIKIVVGNYEIELPYDADVVNEIDFSLKEMYNAIEGDGEATTGNTIGSKYRPATLKDIVKVAVREGWECYGYKMRDFGSYIRCFIDEHENIEDIMHCYKYINKDIKKYTEEYGCDFSKLDMNSMRNISSEAVKHIIDELICTERELLFDTTEDGKTMDIVFVMDFSLKNTGELIGWFCGQDDIDEEYINGLIEDYKKKLFGEEN